MIVKTENLSREFVRGKNQFYAVDHVNLEVEEKELVAIMGQSGSGKTSFPGRAFRVWEPQTGTTERRGTAAGCFSSFENLKSTT